MGLLEACSGRIPSDAAAAPGERRPPGRARYALQLLQVVRSMRLWIVTVAQHGRAALSHDASPGAAALRT